MKLRNRVKIAAICLFTIGRLSGAELVMSWWDSMDVGAGGQLNL